LQLVVIKREGAVESAAVEEAEIRCAEIRAGEGDQVVDVPGLEICVNKLEGKGTGTPPSQGAREVQKVRGRAKLERKNAAAVPEQRSRIQRAGRDPTLNSSFFLRLQGLTLGGCRYIL
jgi:hypothetical protein